ncbi:hypothetical protein WA1_25395 [Scytonema hofmannii PCC 7110]|uniref:Uncharacterized protein n=1 Tax=Scytonema hofmannii PCC 7110 TaxID=128403 RepID=A0A139X8I7_9CYAN|nr:hypothetical protein WA1_25395 [Scytonema hofmannii PCC 7110]
MKPRQILPFLPRTQTFATFNKNVLVLQKRFPQYHSGSGGSFLGFGIYLIFVTTATALKIFAVPQNDYRCSRIIPLLTYTA